MYRVGFPGWKLAARVGLPLKLQVQVHFDPESNSYWAESSALDGLVVAGATIEDVTKEVIAAAQGLFELQFEGQPRASAKAQLQFDATIPCAA